MWANDKLQLSLSELCRAAASMLDTFQNYFSLKSRKHNLTTGNDAVTDPTAVGLNHQYLIIVSADL